MQTNQQKQKKTLSMVNVKGAFLKTQLTVNDICMSLSNKCGLEVEQRLARFCGWFFLTFHNILHKRLN